MWSLFTGGDGGMTKIIDDIMQPAPANEFSPSPLYGQITTLCRPHWRLTKGPDIGLSQPCQLHRYGFDQGVGRAAGGYLDELGVDLSSMYANLLIL